MTGPGAEDATFRRGVAQLQETRATWTYLWPFSRAWMAGFTAGLDIAEMYNTEEER